MNAPAPKWLSMKQTCAVAFGVSRQAILRWIDAGRFPPSVVDPGGNHRFLAADVERWFVWQAECTRAKRRGETPPSAPEWIDPLEAMVDVTQPTEASV